MFKHYLTYQFAVSFHRSCCLIEAEPLKKERVLRSAENMLHQFSRAIRASSTALTPSISSHRHPADAPANAKKQIQDELKFFCVALMCLRDCKESLDEIKALSPALSSEYEVLHARLEQICAKAADAEDGQLMMLG